MGAAGGAAGNAYIKGHLASEHFMGPENQPRLDTMFPPNMEPEPYLVTAMDAFDSEHIGVMHRNATRWGALHGGMGGAAMGALASGIGSAATFARLGSRRRNLPQHGRDDMPHPTRANLRVAGARAAPAA